MNELAQLVDELKRLRCEVVCGVVAQHLSGRKVQVDFRKPALAGAKGFAFRRGEMAVIHVSPELEPAESLKTFLHEVAHVKFHWNVLSGSVLFSQEPGTVKWTRKAEHDRRFQAEQKEDEVKRQAEQWLAQAERLAPGGSMDELLKALLKVS